MGLNSLSLLLITLTIFFNARQFPDYLIGGVFIAFNVLLLFYVIRLHKIRLAECQSKPFQALKYLEKKVGLTDHLSEIIDTRETLKQTKKACDAQLLRPLDYHAFLQEILQAYIEQKEMIENLLAQKKAIIGLSKIVYLEKEADRRFIITQAHINAINLKKELELGYIRFYKPKMPYSDAHKAAYENKKKQQRL